MALCCTGEAAGCLSAQAVRQSGTGSGIVMGSEDREERSARAHTKKRREGRLGDKLNAPFLCSKSPNCRDKNGGRGNL